MSAPTAGWNFRYSSPARTMRRAPARARSPCPAAESRSRSRRRSPAQRSDARRERLVAEVAADAGEALRRAAPREVGELRPERHVVAQDRQAPVQEGLMAARRQALREARGAPGR